MIRILVVDDRNIVRQGVRAILEGKPDLKIVGSANDGGDALEQTVILKPDVLIMDIEMPNVDGITATRQISQQFPEVKILIISSHEDREYIARALQAGASGYLLKDALRGDLERAIRSVYRGDVQIESRLLQKALTDSRQKSKHNGFAKQNSSKAAALQHSSSVAQNGAKSARSRSVPKINLNSDDNLDFSVDLSDRQRDDSPQSLFKFPWLIILGIIGLLIAIGTIVYALNLGDRQSIDASTQEAKPNTQSAIETITALGRIEPKGEKIVLSPPPDMGGTRIQELMVEEGQRVEKGQTIALLDNHELKKAAVATAQQEVAVARANLALTEAGAKTGDIEAKKAVIARLEAELAGKIQTQRASIARLKAQLQRETEAQQANLRRAKAELNNARSQFQRYQKLARDGAISIAELDSRRLTLETAREGVSEAQANYDRTRDTVAEEINEAQANTESTQNTIERQIQEAKASLASIAEVRPLDVQKATAELNKAIADLQQAQQDLELSYVKAPIASQVLRINARPGEIVTQDEGVVELGQTDRMVVIAEIYESDLRLISLGQQAEVVSEGGVFDAQLRGKVTHIRAQIGKKDVFNSDPTADVDTRVVEVEITLDPASSQKVSQFTNSQVVVKIDPNS